MGLVAPIGASAEWVRLLGHFPDSRAVFPAPVGLVLSVSVFLHRGFSVLRPCDEVTVGCCPVRSRDCRLRVMSAFGLCVYITRARGLFSVSFYGPFGFLARGL